MKNAVLAEDHNIAQFAESIEWLLNRPDMAEKIASEARQTLGSLYEWDVLARGIAVIYQMLRSGDYESLQPELKRYIRQSYQPRFWENRQMDADALPADIREQRKGERRQNVVRIDFIERRRVVDAE